MANPRMFKEDVFVIAEIGGNHEGDIDYAFRLIDLAAKSSAHAIKFQTYTADSIVNCKVSPERHAHFKKFELSTADFRKLAERVKRHGRMFLTSVWDVALLDELDDLLPLYKVGSGDLTNYPMLERLARSGKPLILSTAMATLEDIRGAVETITAANPRLMREGKLALLHCVAMYGTPDDSHANLNSIRVLQEAFPDAVIGYSDHTAGTYALELAVALGASIIEKHFSDDVTRDFRDHHISATAETLGDFISKIPRIKTLGGDFIKAPIAAVETGARIVEFRRGLFLKHAMKKGATISETDLAVLRPNTGLDARNWKTLLGKRLKRDIEALEVLSNDDFE